MKVLQGVRLVMVFSKKHRRSIITYTVFRISIVFFSIMVLVLIIVGNIFVSSMRNNIIENRTDLINNTGKTIEDVFEGLKVPMVSLADFSPAQRILEEYDALYSKEWLENIRSIDEYLYNVNTFQDYIIDIALIQEDSTLKYSLTDQFKANYSYTKQDWFKKALEQESLIKYVEPRSTDYLNMSVPFSVTAIYPVTRNDVLRGYIMMEINLQKISSLFESTQQENEGIMLIGSEGKFIFDYHSDRQEIDKELIGDLKALDENQIRSFSATGNLYIAKKLLEPQWCVVSENSFRILTQPIYDSLRIMGIILISGMALIILVTVFMVKKMQKPYERLIERIASYDGSEPIKIYEKKNTPWEIAAVRTKFEEMAGHINRLIQDVYIEKLRKQEMELQVLTNQMNPHFLYNSLQVIQTKAVLSGNQDIEELILALGNMLRYGMERTKEKVLIGDEISYIKDYLMFYKVRFPALFEYEIEYKDEILKYKTIKFILQPIVENCFKHGFHDRKEGGRIRISIEEQSSGIYFSITDNGSGIEEDKVKEMNRQKEMHDMDHHIGILNTAMRIQLAYGPEYGLKIESKEGEYTRVVLEIGKEGGDCV